ncbi:MAG TPA: ankyrin repeat domain-containing protein [Acidimicrobiia bacterium]|nr:ankyrin repeat domain-containing protein [Acidimicrobiia bacterium]
MGVTRCWPSRPNLEQFKGWAVALERQVRAGDAAALDTVRAFHPGLPSGNASTTFALADAQLVIARQYGFSNWPALRRHLAVVERYARYPHEDGLSIGSGNPSDDLLRLGCLLYGNDDTLRHAEARALLEQQPELAGATIYTAAAVGDVTAARRFLTEDPSAAQGTGGPFDWEPLLYLAYSRIDSDAPGHDSVAVARLLLESGADPNAGYLWEGNYPFTALTGVFGGGEDKTNQPPHRHAESLARLLLEAGADPNDSQALYNRQFEPDAAHLRLLIEFGLGTGRGGPWHARLNSAHGTPAQLLEDQLVAAAFENRPEWARLALAAGADPDGTGTRHPLRLGLTPYEAAVRRGNREVAELLRAAGATVPDLDRVEVFLSACMGADRPAVERMLAGSPGVLAEAITRRPDAVLQAAELRRPEAIRLLADLGFDVNVWARITPLHQAAYDGDVAVVQALLDVGADPNQRDPGYNATPLRWAEHARRTDAIELLRRHTAG